MKINYILTLILVFCIGASIPILTGSSQVNEQHSANRKCLIVSLRLLFPHRSPSTGKRSTSGAMTAANGWTAR